MNIFQEVKSAVSTKDAAEVYGIKVGRNKMACCPFHPDKNPSMKVDNRFHCFGCGADGRWKTKNPQIAKKTKLELLEALYEFYFGKTLLSVESIFDQWNAASRYTAHGWSC